MLISFPQYIFTGFLKNVNFKKTCELEINDTPVFFQTQFLSKCAVSLNFGVFIRFWQQCDSGRWMKITS